MKTEEFVKLVEQMRAAQREYFRTRSGDVLVRAKGLEEAVDAAVREMKSGQQRLAGIGDT